MLLNINYLRDREVFLHILGRVNILFEATRRFIFIWKGGWGISYNDSHGEAPPIRRTFSRLQFFLKGYGICRFDIQK